MYRFEELNNIWFGAFYKLPISTQRFEHKFAQPLFKKITYSKKPYFKLTRIILEDVSFLVS